MLRKYKLDGLVFQFEEGTQPARAVPVDDAKDAEPKRKQAKPANKARKASDK